MIFEIERKFEGIDIWGIYQSSYQMCQPMIPRFENIYQEYGQVTREPMGKWLVNFDQALNYATEQAEISDTGADVEMERNLQDLARIMPTRPRGELFSMLLTGRYSFHLQKPDSLELDDIDFEKQYYNMAWKEIW